MNVHICNHHPIVNSYTAHQSNCPGFYGLPSQRLHSTYTSKPDGPGVAQTAQACDTGSLDMCLPGQHSRPRRDHDDAVQAEGGR